MTRIFASPLRIPCPQCGYHREIERREWDASIRSVARPGVPVSIFCAECGETIPAADWHRAYERKMFEKIGIVTPRMQQGEHR